jgi:hypothetical protein
MVRMQASLTEALVALEIEWHDIVREHGDLSSRPYDPERDGRHEVRLRRYKANWDHLLESLVEIVSPASDRDTLSSFTLQ